MNNNTYQQVWQYVIVMRYFTITAINILFNFSNNNRMYWHAIDTYCKYLSVLGKTIGSVTNYLLNRGLVIVAFVIFDDQTIDIRIAVKSLNN